MPSKKNTTTKANITGNFSEDLTTPATKKAASTKKKAPAKKAPTTKGNSVGKKKAAPVVSQDDQQPMDDQMQVKVNNEPVEVQPTEPTTVVEGTLERSTIDGESELAKRPSAAARRAQREAEKAEKEARKNDPMTKIEARRMRAINKGGAYLMACDYCGSEDVNANRSAYMANVNGEEVQLKDYRCASCHKYTRTIADTGMPIDQDATVKVLHYVTTRKNYHRAKGHAMDMATQLAGVEGYNGDQIDALDQLIQRAKAGDEAARKVLSEGVVIKIAFAADAAPALVEA